MDELTHRGGPQKNITEVRVNPYRVKESDEVLNVFVLPTQIILPLTLGRGKAITVKDKVGASPLSRIVVTVDENAKIDGLSQVNMQGKYSSATFIWDGREWSIY